MKITDPRFVALVKKDVNMDAVGFPYSIVTSIPFVFGSLVCCFCRQTHTSGIWLLPMCLLLMDLKPSGEKQLGLFWHVEPGNHCVWAHWNLSAIRGRLYPKLANGKFKLPSLLSDPAWDLLPRLLQVKTPSAIYHMPGMHVSCCQSYVLTILPTRCPLIDPNNRLGRGLEGLKEMLHQPFF